jgi:hypothetical protein
MTPAQVTRGIAMRRYAWGKRIKQIADESGVPPNTIRDVLMAKPFSDAVRSRLEGYLKTPAGPAALVQNYDRVAFERKGITAARFMLLRRVVRLRKIAEIYQMPLAAKHRLKAMTDGELHAYFYTLSIRLKRAIMARERWITDKYKFFDSMEVWEFIERVDQLRTKIQAQNSGRPQDRPLPAPARS